MVVAPVARVCVCVVGVVGSIVCPWVEIRVGGCLCVCWVWGVGCVCVGCGCVRGLGSVDWLVACLCGRGWLGVAVHVSVGPGVWLARLAGSVVLGVAWCVPVCGVGDWVWGVLGVRLVGGWEGGCEVGRVWGLWLGAVVLVA